MMIIIYILLYLPEKENEPFSDILQMAVWVPSQGRLYLPPQKPVAKVLSTDDYIVKTDLYFHASTDRLLTVGHPYFDILSANQQNIDVPKVSGNQYRVFRLQLPDPNQFALIDKTLYNPDHERLVWRLSGIEIDRGGPLGIGSTGHPLFNKLGDTENPSVYNGLITENKENRMNVSFDPKQNQLFLVGCQPAIGQHWDKAEPCPEANPDAGSCPPLKLVHTPIEDGDMSDIGLGNINFSVLSDDKSSAPLEIINSTCKWPDFAQMTKDIYGDRAFFFGRREQLYSRHSWCRDGLVGDAIPDEHFYLTPDSATQPQAPQNKLGSSIYFTIPSGSLASSESNIFGRPYWLHKAQGANNGIAWGNQLFVTILDNTHNTNFTISVKTETVDSYDKNKFKQYVRHAEEVEIEIICQLCKVPLEADILAHLYAMNPSILDAWQLAFVPSPPQNLEDTYRYIRSLATMCPADQTPKEPEDPYKNLHFWTIDLKDRFTSDLDQTPLGKRFLYQMGLITGNKRLRTDYVAPTVAKRRKIAKSAKRRKTNA